MWAEAWDNDDERAEGETVGETKVAMASVDHHHVRTNLDVSNLILSSLHLPIESAKSYRIYVQLDISYHLRHKRLLLVVIIIMSSLHALDKP
jgi:hypothetical protein